ncbi:MAG: ATP-dependent RNA helicase DeaD [Holosporales bacterium]
MTTITFDAFNLNPILNDSLKKMAFVTPTPIQERSIPVALLGRDVFGTAQTGTGKTAAFGIPVLEHLFNKPKETALILTPTRELAVQVLSMLDKLNNRSMRSALLIGGESMGKQLSQLSARPRFIVGTPGRINDHLSRNTLKLDQCSFLVLDETDRMLDMGFGVQLETIIPHLRDDRQTMMFSATMEKGIVKIAQQYLNDAEHITIGSVTTPADTVKQENVHVKESEKFDTLINHLEEYSGTFIVFTNTKIGAHDIAKRLRTKGVRADAIHGDLRQRDRDRVIRSFQKSAIRVLVATDVAARGLDIPHIEYVVNYDLPLCPEDYIHRIGRTGRAGAQGMAINLISDKDERKWRAISQLISPEKGKKPTPFGRGPKSEGRGPRRGDKPFSRSRSDRPRRDDESRSFSRDRDDRREGRGFNRDDAPRSFNRDDRKFNRDDAPRSFNRDDAPRSFNRDDAPRSFNRDDAPRSFNRDDRKFNRDDAPRSFNRDDREFSKDRSDRPFVKRDRPPFSQDQEGHPSKPKRSFAPKGDKDNVREFKKSRDDRSFKERKGGDRFKSSPKKKSFA